MQGYCDVYKRTISQQTSPEVKYLHLTSSRREVCTPSVNNVIYHKFSHGGAFYTLNGKNVNVMLESAIIALATGFKPIQEYFQHDFAGVTDEANGSVVLAEL